MTDSVELPDVPDADTWSAMTPEERMAVVRAFRAVLGVGRLGSPTECFSRPNLRLRDYACMGTQRTAEGGAGQAQPDGA